MSVNGSIATAVVAVLGVTAGTLAGTAVPAGAAPAASYMPSTSSNDTTNQDVLGDVRNGVAAGLLALRRERSNVAKRIAIATATSAGLTGTPATAAGQFIAGERRQIRALDRQIAGLTSALRSVDIPTLGDCTRDGHPTQRTRDC
jgi:hypothetical protein